MAAASSALPIYAIRDALATALRGGARRFVLSAPTGSGKSTQVPQMLVDDDTLLPLGGQVVVLQPRRLPARLLAKRVAEERGVRLGGEVGYHIRFDAVAGPETRIKYVTEGLLLRQMLGDPSLRGVGALLFDEFHERHLHGDISLAQAVELQRTRRPDLVIGVMSATLDAEGVARYLEPCAVLRSEGRMFPVAIGYDGPAGGGANEVPVWERATRAFAGIAREGTGHVLVFMPGAYEISRTLGALAEHPAAKGFDLFALHGELSPEKQDAAVAPSVRRKVIVATNVAETSLTIDGVDTVIDSGLARVPAYDAQRGLNTLLVQKISQASADQRAGRAGRTRPGQCLRLWGEREHAQRPVRELPEVRRLDLSETVLTLRAGGVRDFDCFPWFEAPEPRSLARAIELLTDLGALDARGQLTPTGLRLSSFPLHPRYGRMLLAAGDAGCVPAVAAIAACAQGKSFLLPLEGKAEEDRLALLGGEALAAQSDFFPLLAALEEARRRDFDFGWCKRLGLHAQGARQAAELTGQLLRLAAGAGLPTAPISDDPATIRRCVLAGFADHLAKRLDRGTLRCALVHQRRGELRRSSAVQQAPLLVSAEIEERDQRGDVTVLLGQNTAVEEAWLDELFPGAIEVAVKVAFDIGQKRVVALRERSFRGLVLETKETNEAPPAELAARLLVDEIEAGRLELKQWDESVETWVARVNFLARHCADYGFAAIGPDDKRLLLEQWAFGATSAKDLRERSLWPTLRQWLPAGLADQMDRLAPERYLLPRGYRAPITYAPDGSRATLSATVQQFYDCPGRVLLAEGRAPVTFELLAPSRRPVQVTDDLDAFWQGSYERVKKDLKGRYPKHEWR